MLKTALPCLFALLLFLPATEAREAPRAEVQALAQSTRSWDGALLPAYPSGQPQVSILRISIPPGTRLPTHYHPVINAGVLLAGELTVVAEDGEQLRLRAGDAIVEMVNRLHHGVNEGGIPAEIIVFYAGVEGKPITVIEAQADH